MTKGLKSVRRWVIVSNCGPYIGQCLTRADMIAEHVSKVCTNDDGSLISEFAIGGALSGPQKAAWEKCKKRGDRAVHATISYEAPAP